MSPQQLQAQNGYLHENKTQREIAEEVGVSEKTIYNWILQFGWHERRETIKNTCNSIVENLCSQILEFQKTIAARPEGQRFPTPTEVALQSKLINNLLRLQKRPAKQKQNRSVNTLQNTLETLVNLTAQSTSDTLPQPVKTGNGSATEPSQPTAERAPITEQDFNDYKHLLTTQKQLPNNHTTRFRGRFVNTKWLLYNLFQYCLPSPERIFINDARRVATDVDTREILQKITAYSNENCKKAA